ncbi:molybdate ABC transporter substrate-binding protein [Kaarinaea lacus]
MLTRNLVAILFFLSPWQILSADEIRIAVASNFTDSMETIITRFKQQTGHNIVVAYSSTGKHYAQIVNGAPFDAFFAADVRRPQLLEEAGLTVMGTRFTYAIGRLALWSPKRNYVDSAGEILNKGDFTYLAIANPKLAPYGRAAQQVLQKKGLWEQLQNRMVRGENIGQTFQFVMSGNAPLGFVALSQLKQLTAESAGSYCLFDQSLYDAIEQQAVMLNDSPAIRSFMQFMKSDAARAIIKRGGYDTP